MSFQVIADECQQSGTQATVVIEGDTIAEVVGKDAKEAAIKHGQTVLGLNRPGHRLAPQSYPVGTNLPLDNVVPGGIIRTAGQSPQAPATRYRAKHSLQASL